MPEKTLWIVSKEAVGARRMGPVVRLFDMIEQTQRRTEWKIRVLCASWEGSRPEGVSVSHDIGDLLTGWKTGDPVVLDAYSPGRWIFRLLASRIPFDADFYCLSLPETAEVFPDAAPDWMRRERIRRSLKYAWICGSARSVYVSSQGQILSLSGILAGGPSSLGARICGHLPQRCLQFPMGTREAPEIESPTPYPEVLRHRPVALWGGGIWPWLDTTTLVEAFARMPDPDRGPALFFLASTNGRPDPDADSPIESVRRLARSKGLLDRNIFFNASSVSPEGLGPWLRHARMGVMANPHSWESNLSWRTRYLDLLSHGIPLVVSGSDPLGDRMIQAGAARGVPVGDATALAQEILEVAEDDALHSKLADGARRMSSSLSIAELHRKWIDSVLESTWEPRTPSPIGLGNLLRFKLGW